MKRFIPAFRIITTSFTQKPLTCVSINTRAFAPLFVKQQHANYVATTKKKKKKISVKEKMKQLAIKYGDVDDKPQTPLQKVRELIRVMQQNLENRKQKEG